MANWTIAFTADQVQTMGAISLLYVAAVFVMVAGVRGYLKLRKGIKDESR